MSVPQLHAATPTTYAWSSTAASTWNAAGNWTAISGLGGSFPVATDSITTPVAAPVSGAVPTVTLAATDAVTNWNFSLSGANWQVLSAPSIGSTLSISGTMTIDDAGVASSTDESIFNNGSSGTLSLSIGAIALNNGRLYLGGFGVMHSVTVSGLTTIGGTSNNSTARLVLGLDTLSGAAANFAGGVFFNTGATTTALAEDFYFNNTGTSTSASVAFLSGGYTSPGVSTKYAVVEGLGTASLSTLILNGNDAGINSFGGLITDTTTGTVLTAIAKTGTDTQVFTGTSNSYSGGTTISGGNLQINNASGSGLGSGAVALNGGTNTTLSGTGSATGLVTVTNGSRIAPGVNTTDADSTGHYNFGVAGKLSLGTTGGLTLTAANLDLDLSGSSASASSNDYIATGGTLALTSVTVNINELGGTLLTGIPYAIITGASSVTNFATSDFTTNFINGGTSYTPSYTDVGNNIDVTFATAAPEPGCLGILALGGLTLIRRRRSTRKLMQPM